MGNSRRGVEDIPGGREGWWRVTYREERSPGKDEADCPQLSARLPVARHSSLFSKLSYFRASQVMIVVKNLPANAGDVGSIPSSGRSLGVGSGNPLQCTCFG